MKKKFKYLVFLMPLIFLSSVNFSVKANDKKNTVDKVTVVELKDQEYPTYSFIKKKSRKKTIGKFSAFNFDRLNRINRSYKGNRYKPGVSVKAENDFIPSNYGKNRVPHTTSTVKSNSRPKISTEKHSITSSKPYIAVGKIYSVTNNIGTECTGTLIGKAVVVTSAECIAEWGGSVADPSVADKVWFTPAATNSFGEDFGGPIGMWKAKKLYIPSCFTAGDCLHSDEDGIQENNIALFTLRKKGGRTPFDMGATYLNYGWNNPGFVKYSLMYAGQNKVAQITTLGYPTNLGDKSGNSGGAMIKTDSVAVSIVIEEENDLLPIYLWGSGQPQANGSPVIINFGFKPFNSSSAYEGEYSTPNVITGIQFDNEDIRKIHAGLGNIFGQNISYPKKKYQDKSGRNWGAGNIGFLMRKVCGQGYDKGQSKGICLNR